MAGQLLQAEAIAKRDFGLARASVVVWPLDHTFRRTLVEWMLLWPVTPEDKRSSLDFVLRNDPYAADARLLSAVVANQAGNHDLAQRDLLMFLALAPRSKQAKALMTNSERTPSPPSLEPSTGGKETER